MLLFYKVIPKLFTSDLIDIQLIQPYQSYFSIFRFKIYWLLLLF